MVKIALYPACLYCTHTDVDVSTNTFHAFIECKHKGVCRLIVNQQPIIDTYNMSAAEAKEAYGYGSEDEA